MRAEANLDGNPSAVHQAPHQAPRQAPHQAPRTELTIEVSSVDSTLSKSIELLSTPPLRVGVSTPPPLSVGGVEDFM